MPTGRKCARCPATAAGSAPGARSGAGATTCRGSSATAPSVPPSCPPALVSEIGPKFGIIPQVRPRVGSVAVAAVLAVLGATALPAEARAQGESLQAARDLFLEADFRRSRAAFRT